MPRRPRAATHPLAWMLMAATAVAQTASAPPQSPVPADALTLLPGFQAELLYTVPKASQGSWVALAADDRGRLYASDQQRGLYRVTPPALGDPDAVTVVERVAVDLGGAQGLLWAFDSLYVVVNGRGSGLYRLRDTDGDDRLDEVRQLAELHGEGEHGPHAVVLAPGGAALLVAAGNHTALPELQGSRLPTSWAEDLLLPRMWDPRGHARGLLAPGGFVCRVDPDGARWELWSVGFRNAYDFAVSRDGEVFTFDSDMEWDMGMPWYRPTRVCHVVSGGDFGWRSGSGKFPTDYPDTLPPVLDIGPGSPTGVLFGTGTRFPARYRDALFVLDWTFGTIYAVHLAPDGASYRGEAEEFASGRPLPLTDAVVGGDGAFYFATGGRGTQSELYRIHYAGDASVEPATVEGAGSAAGAGAATEQAARARALRHELEAFHGRRDEGAVAAAWPHLADRDRFVRYAARLALEAQPVAAWQARALAERDPEAAITALLALARHGEPGTRRRLLDALGRLDPSELTEPQLLAALRVHGIAFTRMGEPDHAERAEALARLDPLFPTGRARVDAELARLLAHLDAPAVVDRALALLLEAEAAPGAAPSWAELIARNDTYGGTIRRMLEDPPPTRAIHYAFVLRNLRFGWALDQRREYFEFFARAAAHPGGSSYQGFLEGMRSDALAHCSAAEREALAGLTGEQLGERAPFEPSAPNGPGRRWTVRDALAACGDGPRGRSFQSGRNLFHALACAACHRFDGAGGDIGPDLSSVGQRLGHQDLLESILEPSKVISDQYGSSIVTAADGSKTFGRVVDRAGADPAGVVEVYPPDPTTPPVRLRKSQIRSIESSSVSQMPEGLIDPLNPDELLDLLAYLLSRGDPDDPVFRK